MLMTVTQTFYHQQQLWAAGSTIEVDAYLAQPLVEQGFLEPAKPAAPAAPQPSFATKVGRGKAIA